MNFNNVAAGCVHEAPEKFEEKFDAFRAAIKSLHSEMSTHDGHLVIKGAEHPFDSGLKYILHIRQKAVHIRYYDTSLATRSGLGLLEIDMDKECYILNKSAPYLSAEQAITDFLALAGVYADNKFMRLIYKALSEEENLDFQMNATPRGLTDQETKQPALLQLQNKVNKQAIM